MDGIVLQNKLLIDGNIRNEAKIFDAVGQKNIQIHLRKGLPDQRSAIIAIVSLPGKISQSPARKAIVPESYPFLHQKKPFSCRLSSHSGVMLSKFTFGRLDATSNVRPLPRSSSVRNSGLEKSQTAPASSNSFAVSSSP